MATMQEPNPDKLLLTIGGIAAGIVFLVVLATFFGLV